jgi:hypothetical protein
MSVPVTGCVAWRVGPRAYSIWHLTGDDLWVTLCDYPVPTRPLDHVSRVRGRDKSPTCKKCTDKHAALTAASLRIA